MLDKVHSLNSHWRDLVDIFAVLELVFQHLDDCPGQHIVEHFGRFNLSFLEDLDLVVILVDDSVGK